jgi:hypothetical protein
LYKLDSPWRVLEVEATTISRQSAHEGGKVVSPTHRPPLPPGKNPWYSFLLEDEDLSIKNLTDPFGNRTRDIQQGNKQGIILSENGIIPHSDFPRDSTPCNNRGYSSFQSLDVHVV